MASTPSRLRAAPADPAPTAAPPETRRSYPLIAAGLLASLVGALLFATIADGSDDRQAVLAVARPVAAGAVISAEDLATVRMVPGKGIAFISATDARTVVGRTAAVGLVPGGLIASSQLGSPSGLAEGQGAIGMVLEPGRYPPGLRAGDQVAIVSAPSGPVGAEGGSLRLGTGIVEDAVPTAGAAGVTIRMTVEESAVDRVAAEGAARRVALVLLPPGAVK